MQKVEIDGVEVEVYTADEVTARETAAKTAAEAEWKPKVDDLSTKLTDAQRRAAERSGEFAQFRKLSDEQFAKLDEAQQIIYRNGVALEAEREKGANAMKLVYENDVANAVRKQTGNDQKLFDETMKMYQLVGLDDSTPEALEKRAAAAFAAMGTTQPDLLAAAGFQGGSYQPPVTEKKDTSFADTDAGKEMAGKLGLNIEVPK